MQAGGRSAHYTTRALNHASPFRRRPRTLLTSPAVSEALSYATYAMRCCNGTRRLRYRCDLRF